MTETIKRRTIALRDRLYDNLLKEKGVLNFWLNHSIDWSHGGYFNCLGPDGTVYDTTKYVWLQCRQVWMLSRLYIDTTAPISPLKRDEILSAARHGAEFMKNKLIYFDKEKNLHRCYFRVDRDGKGIASQRKIFSECFFVMAAVLYGAVTGDSEFTELGLKVFDDIQSYIAEPQLLGFRAIYEGTTAFEPLNIPMICLNIIDEIRCFVPGMKNAYDDLARNYIQKILKHVDFVNHCCREHVLPDGSFDDVTGDGRMLMWGHQIECGWFVVEICRKYPELTSNIPGISYNPMKIAVQVIEWAFEKGWDYENEGGLLYFGDALGMPRTELEGPQKLWWPLTEALTAFTMLFEQTREEKYLELAERVYNVCDKYMNDDEHGEWFGYCTRDWQQYMKVKGGPYKGCFHVPRGLLFSGNSLNAVVSGSSL